MDKIKKMPFIASILFVSGCMNAYSNCIYGVVAGAHTGDLTKLSFGIVKGDWTLASFSIFMILAAIAGVVLAEGLKYNFKGNGDWRKVALWFLAAGLGFIATVSDGVEKNTMCYVCSLLCGFMLNLFRDGVCGTFNSTIATGNMRTLGQYFYEAMNPKAPGDWMRFLRFLLVIAAYFAGAIIMSFSCNILGKQASIFPAAICAIMAIAMKKYELDTEREHGC